MSLKLFVLLTLMVYCECAYIYSSFYAPLFNPRILNFRVDAPFDPDGGKKYREDYEKNYGYRGERLIANLGNGLGPGDVPLRKDIGSVRFYYTYPGAERDSAISYNSI